MRASLGFLSSFVFVTSALFAPADGNPPMDRDIQPPKFGSLDALKAGANGGDDDDDDEQKLFVGGMGKGGGGSGQVLEDSSSFPSCARSCCSRTWMCRLH